MVDGILVRLRKSKQSTRLSDGVGTRTWEYLWATRTGLLHLCERTLTLRPFHE